MLDILCGMEAKVQWTLIKADRKQRLQQQEKQQQQQQQEKEEKQRVRSTLTSVSAVLISSNLCLGCFHW